LKEVTVIPGIDAMNLNIYLQFIFIVYHKKHKQQYVVRLQW